VLTLKETAHSFETVVFFFYTSDVVQYSEDCSEFGSTSQYSGYVLEHL
jgi:hypothetical protein